MFCFKATNSFFRSLEPWSLIASIGHKSVALKLITFIETAWVSRRCVSLLIGDTSFNGWYQLTFPEADGFAWI